jgi:hypothetical protein
MTLHQLITTLRRPSGSTRPQQSPRPVVLTRSEIAECNCPEHCERDHEVD